MKTNLFRAGDTKTFVRIVTEEHLARFEAGEVHPLYATFAIAQDMEWVCRLFVLELLEEGEEGIGTQLTIEHLSPCLLGEEAHLTATLVAIEANTVFCTVEVRVQERIIAQGSQTQKILDKARFMKLLEKLKTQK